MSQTEPEPYFPLDPRLDVVEAMRQGWRLMRSDFWPLWVVGLVSMLVPGISGPAIIVVGPPILAGLYYVLARRMAGKPVETGLIFQGFTQVFKPSVIAGLVPFGVAMATMFIWLPIHFAIIFGMLARTGSQSHPPLAQILVPIAIDFAVLIVLLLVSGVVRLFFIFAQCAVWNMRQSGWEAAKFSVRLVIDNLGPIVKMVLLFALVVFVINIIGIATCGVGSILLVPAFEVWWGITILTLYRSWTGRFPIPLQADEVLTADL